MGPANHAAMQEAGYYRFATIAGDAIVFVCEDDLWSVPADGGTARRLTASTGEITTPRLSPDGSRVAFVAREEGHPEIYVMDAGGSSPRRLTFLGADVCLLSGWTPDGSSLLFVSDSASPFGKETQGFSLRVDGGAPTPLALGHMRSLTMHPDGRIAIGRNNDDPARWKRYRGGTAGDLWVDAHGDGAFTRLVTLDGNVCWPMWIGDRIAFISDHEGVANIYSVRADGGDLQRHTNETEYFVRFPATDGRRIVYTAGAAIRILDMASGSVSQPQIAAPSTAPQAARRFEAVGDMLEEFAPSPDGTTLALISRGQPFTMPLWDGAVLAHGQGSAVRYRCATWLSDGKRFACVSDEGGQERIEIHHALRESERVIVTDENIGRVTEMVASPTADIVAIANHRYELLLVDLTERRVRVIDKSPATRIHDITFSPDGRWIAYSCAIRHDAAIAANPDTAIIRIAKVKSGVVHDATPVLRVDRSPAWDPEGKYLFFISTRDFNPVYDALQFDLSFPQATRPFVITLRRDVPSPFISEPSPIHKDHKHDDAPADDKGKDDDKPPRVEIDFDGITGRVLGFPIDEG
ncbi:MAG TPA: hypothetical protein VGD50_05270, partial [Candidatus Baltobacteraceae bacterium]